MLSGDGSCGKRWPGAHVESVQWIQKDHEAVGQHLRARESSPGEIRQAGKGGGVGSHEEGGKSAYKTEVRFYQSILREHDRTTNVCADIPTS